MSDVQAEEVTINLAGSHILGLNGQAIVAVSGRDREITRKMYAGPSIRLVRFNCRPDAKS